jgi:hypothetical protein
VRYVEEIIATIIALTVALLALALALFVYFTS